MIKRDLFDTLVDRASLYPVVTLIGPRQAGKSTLARAAFKHKPYVNLEDPDIRAFANSDARAFLSNYPDGAILDEIQNTPQLLSYIQVIVDEKKEKGQFILTGSHQLSLHQAISQSLAGRTAVLTLLPLSIHELKNHNVELSSDSQIFQGGYPRVFAENLNPSIIYADYYRTYVERDIRQMINLKDVNLFEKFIKLSAGRIGSVFEASSLANEVGVSSHTINHWLSILEASFIVFRLQPYFENFGKRLIKSPKLYFNDVGLACYLLDIQNIKQLARDPLRGALFENLAILELIKFRYNQGLPANIYYYRDNHKNEVDAILKSGHELIPIEIKSAQTFHQGFLKNLHFYQKINDGRSRFGFVVYDGLHEQSIDNINVINYRNIDKIWLQIEG